MRPALIIALILFPMRYAAGHSWRILKREQRGTSLQDISNLNAAQAVPVFGERRQASAINGPGGRHRLNDQVARLLTMLAATSFAIAIASRYLSTW